jgi:hypothetical protein
MTSVGRGIYEAHIVVFELRQGESPHASQGREVYLWLWSPSVELDAWVSNLESHNMNVFAGWKLGHVESAPSAIGSPSSDRRNFNDIQAYVPRRMRMRRDSANLETRSTPLSWRFRQVAPLEKHPMLK